MVCNKMIVSGWSKAVAFASSLEVWAFALPLLFVLAAFASSAPDLQKSVALAGISFLPAELSDGNGQALYSGLKSNEMMNLGGL